VRQPECNLGLSAKDPPRGRLGRVADFDVPAVPPLRNPVAGKLIRTVEPVAARQRSRIGALSPANFRSNFGAFAIERDDCDLCAVDSGGLCFDADSRGSGILIFMRVGEPTLASEDIFIT
jgi:hypothetical protein